jgi:tripartite-type tricarboxylate transporter receptor subunit TctC
MNIQTWVRAVSAAGLAAICFNVAAGAQAVAQTASWPQRNVRFIIPFGPGSGADISARLLSPRLQQKWGQAVVVENRPGGDAMVAINAFIGASDDHTLLYGAVASFVAHPYLYENLSYVRERDLLPIARVSVTVMAVGIPEALGPRNLKEFVAHAKANPGKLNAASVQGMSEIIFYGWMKREGLDVSKVPYRDIVQAVPDLGEGRLQIVMSSLAPQLPLVAASKVRVVGVGNRRTPVIDAPTISEAGFPALDHAGLIGLFGPRGMGSDLRKRIAGDVIEAGAAPEISERLTGTAQLPAFAGPEEFEKSIAQMIATLDSAAAALEMKRKQ